MKTCGSGYAIGASSFVLAALVVGAAAQAQTYPTRAITAIIPFAGGSASDVVSRILFDRMSRSMGQPIIVENRPGAGGNSGTAAGAKAAPDGYTLLGGGSGPLSANNADAFAAATIVRAPDGLEAGAGWGFISNIFGAKPSWNSRAAANHQNHGFFRPAKS